MSVLYFCLVVSRRDEKRRDAMRQRTLRETLSLSRVCFSLFLSIVSSLSLLLACLSFARSHTLSLPLSSLPSGHHFHLGCIYEWYERSEKCPVCEEKMEFEPSTGMCL